MLILKCYLFIFLNKTYIPVLLLMAKDGSLMAKDGSYKRLKGMLLWRNFTVYL